PFQRGERLYGRDIEQTDLLNLLISERIVLLYSPSGAGKTSIIQAALVPALEEERFRVLPLIHVSRPLPADGDPAANRYVASTLLAGASGLAGPGLSRADLAHPPVTGLRGGGEGERGADARERAPVVMILDQFEETLTADPTDIEAKTAFFAQLGEALKARH